MGPGGLWHAADKKIKKSYSCATSSGDSLSIRFFSITWAADTCAIIDELNTSSYDLSKISVVRSEDEDGRVAFEFRDIEGKLLLSRKRINSDYLDTHYLYDVHGNLEFVSPPKLSYILQGDILELSDDVISAYAWQYRYDDEGKMIARKFPGAAWEYYVYDAGGRKVLSQDGKLRSLGKWKFHVKDGTAAVHAFDRNFSVHHIEQFGNKVCEANIPLYYIFTCTDLLRYDFRG